MTRRFQNRLTAISVRNQTKPGKYGDGGGLILVVDKNGNKRWSFVYSRGTRRCELGLGIVRDVSLATARSMAAQYREALAMGDDPKTIKQNAARTVTFGEFADHYVESMKPSWRNPKHVAQWVMTLTKYAAPLRKKLIHEITTDDVVRVLKPRWSATPETANRLRGRIESVLDSAKVLGLREGDNPARWRGHLDQILPRRRALTKGHHAALPFAELPAFMQGLQARSADAARALEFAILTACRTNELLGMRWQELDVEAGIWTVPAERMKAFREHRVPLSPVVLDLLAQLPRGRSDDLVFRNADRKKPLSIMALPMLLRRMNVAVTVHGFRSTFRDWAAETTNFPNEVCEMALAHTIPGKVESAYRRGDLFLKRRRLMDEWARYCRGEYVEAAERDRVPMPGHVAFSAGERRAMKEMLSNVRCPLCGSAWGERCRTEDEQPLDWPVSHERRLLRLVEDWALVSDAELEAAVSGSGTGPLTKVAVMKVELARRGLTPGAWAAFIGSQIGAPERSSD